MTCAACAVRLEKVLKRLPDVDAEVNFATASARLTSRTVQPPDLAAMAAVARAGFQVPLSRQRLTLEGMTCAACAQRIEKCSIVCLAYTPASTSPPPAPRWITRPAWSATRSCWTRCAAPVIRRSCRATTPRHICQRARPHRPLAAGVRLLALPFVAEMLAMLAGRHGLLPVAWRWALATPVQFWWAGALSRRLAQPARRRRQYGCAGGAGHQHGLSAERLDGADRAASWPCTLKPACR